MLCFKVVEFVYVYILYGISEKMEKLRIVVIYFHFVILEDFVFRASIRSDHFYLLFFPFLYP